MERKQKAFGVIDAHQEELIESLRRYLGLE